MKAPSFIGRPVVAASIVAAQFLSVVVAADDRYEVARRAAQVAQVMQEKGQWTEAQAQLDRESRNCGTDAAGRSCRLLLRYSQAYLSEREARRSPENATVLLASAESRYREVLSEAPLHEATLKNLALIYRELGREADAERLLKEAVESDRSGAGRAELLLGRHYRDLGRFDAALASFERAATANPGDPAAPQAIVALYADSAPNRLGTLLPRLAAWAPTMPTVAVEGYRQILRGAPGTPDGERALLPWVSLIARQGWVSPSTFSGLPQGWLPLEELIRYVSSPENPPSSSGWWMQHALRRSVLAELAPATAQAPEARANPARALRRLQVGMMFCPPYEEYLFRAELKSAWPARMELARAMLTLLSRQPDLDPSGQRQRDLLNDVFAGKAGAYRSEDLVAMQRFHTTLGRWYAERGEWPGSGSTNARFQLEHALDAAEQRVKRGEPYQPLQDEKAMLAGGYMKLEQPAKARSTYLQAAAAYLDTDQLQQARDSLASANGIGTPAPSASDLTQSALVQRVLATREAVAKGSVAPGFEQQIEQRWLSSDAMQAFVKRQQFKTMSDLALQANETGQEKSAAVRAGLAFAAALDLKSMVGTADLVRLEKAKGLATARAEIADRRTAVVAARPGTTPGEVAWPVYVPAENQPVYIKVSADAVLASRFDVQLRRDPKLGDKVLRYSVESGNVTVYVPSGDNAVVDAVERMPRVEGLGMLTTMQRP